MMPAFGIMANAWYKITNKAGNRVRGQCTCGKNRENSAKTPRKQRHELRKEKPSGEERPTARASKTNKTADSFI